MGAKNTGYAGNKTFLKLKSKTSDTDPTPGFFKTEKVGDKWINTESFNSVDGDLVSIQHTTYTYENKQKDKCIMTFKDPDGSETNVDVNFSSLLYGVLNSLCNLSKFDNVEIQTWLGKPDKRGKEWPKAGVKRHGEKVEWYYAIDILPKVKSEEYKGHVIKDDSEVIDFWKQRISEINDMIGLQGQNAPTPAPESTDASPDDDLPF